MQSRTAEKLLARVLGWKDDDVLNVLPTLTLLSEHKYDHYQRFNPGRRFIESLALWLNQFDDADRRPALDLVLERLIFFSEKEMSHLVSISYPDVIVQERLKIVSEELGIPSHYVRTITGSKRFDELRHRSLYLGLSDGARTNELRRYSDGEISNEQIWQAYELGEEKAGEMLDKLRDGLGERRRESAHFNLVWLLDDFSASGNTYIRFDPQTRRFKGKLPKIYSQLHTYGIIEPAHYEVYLLLYAATQQALDHIEYWSSRFTGDMGYKPLQVRSVCTLDRSIALTNETTTTIGSLLGKEKYFDSRVARDKHIAVGGTDGRLGFAGCALPVVLSHNTPNNSIYMLWGPDTYDFRGLFPRVSRHRDT